MSYFQIHQSDTRFSCLYISFIECLNHLLLLAQSNNAKKPTKNTKVTLNGIHRGANTHTQLHWITSSNFNVMKTIARSPQKLIPLDFCTTLFIFNLLNCIVQDFSLVFLHESMKIRLPRSSRKCLFHCRHLRIKCIVWQANFIKHNIR